MAIIECPVNASLAPVRVACRLARPRPQRRPGDREDHELQRLHEAPTGREGQARLLRFQAPIIRGQSTGLLANRAVS